MAQWTLDRWLCPEWWVLLRAVKLRMRSIQNIGKITSAMKMVAASKMRVAQQATENSRGITYPLLKLLGDHPGAPDSRHKFTWMLCR